MIYIFDIDGTLADLSHRLHHIQKTPADWDGFFGACADDKPIYPVIATAQALYKAKALILLVSGRSDVIRDKTESWLSQHRIPYHELYMRKAGDHREDSVVKAELLGRIRAEWKDITHEIMGVFEDRKQVVDMYRAHGLRVFQVAEGNF